MYVTVGNMKERHFSPSSYSNIYALLLNPLYQLAIATCMSRRQQVGVFACFVSVFAKGLFPRTRTIHSSPLPLPANIKPQ